MELNLYQLHAADVGTQFTCITGAFVLVLTSQ
jgi:hypothetical protein